MRILVHTCCADCLLKIVNSFKCEKTDIVGYFYNPNIHPRAEYLARLKAAQKISQENGIKLVIPDWSPKEYFEEIKSKNNRCKKCWYLRLRKTFEYAKKNDFEIVSTTLLSSHYQNKEEIEKIGKNLEKEFEIKFSIPKKIEKDLKTSGFYKQNYCGCCFSLTEDWLEKFR